MTDFNDALDKVKEWRGMHQKLSARSYYRNISAEQLNELLQGYKDRWGERFMECVARELTAERHGEEIAAQIHGAKGIRD